MRDPFFPSRRSKTNPTRLISIGRILSILLLASWLLALPAHAAQGTPRPGPSRSSATVLRVGTSANYPPMEYFDHSQIVGHDITLMNAIAAQMGVSLTYTDIVFNDLWPALDNDLCDVVISAVSILPERESGYDFSLPYVTFAGNDRIGIVVKKGNDALRRQINQALWALRTNGTLLANKDAILADLPSSQATLPEWPEVLPAASKTFEFAPAAVSLDIPAGGVSQPTLLTYNPLGSTANSGSHFFAGLGFQLDAFQGGTFAGGLTFAEPATLTVHYMDTDAAGAPEQSLVLWIWDDNANQWLDAPGTCAQNYAVVRDLGNNSLEVKICRPGRFALFGQYSAFLPVIQHH